MPPLTHTNSPPYPPLCSRKEGEVPYVNFLLPLFALVERATVGIFINLEEFRNKFILDPCLFITLQTLPLTPSAQAGSFAKIACQVIFNARPS